MSPLWGSYTQSCSLSSNCFFFWRASIRLLMNLGSKLYPSNIPGMRNNGLTRFLQNHSRERQNWASEMRLCWVFTPKQCVHQFQRLFTEPSMNNCYTQTKKSGLKILTCQWEKLNVSGLSRFVPRLPPTLGNVKSSSPSTLVSLEPRLHGCKDPSDVTQNLK